MNGIKGASAHSINKALGRKGSVWQDESFDHILRRRALRKRLTISGKTPSERDWWTNLNSGLGTGRGEHSRGKQGEHSWAGEGEHSWAGEHSRGRLCHMSDRPGTQVHRPDHQTWHGRPCHRADQRFRRPGRHGRVGQSRPGRNHHARRRQGCCSAGGTAALGCAG